MELERGSKAGSTLSLKWNGDVLSTEASMICLILACCRCDRVPALLFTRPYNPRRRWNIHEEIELADPPPADVIPEWPLKVFVDATESPSRGKGDFLEGSHKDVSAQELPPRLSPSIKHLCQQNVISTKLEGEDLSFQMVKFRREEIWEQTSTDDRLLLWFDLLKLIIYSSPDVYAESFWQSLLCNCKPVIESTLLPFLSVLEWTHLRHHLAIIPRLVSFLLHFSILNGFSLDTSVYLAPGLLRHIESSCSVAVKTMLEILKFKELFCFHLLHLHEKDRKSRSDPLGALLKNTEMHGILGFLIASILRSNQASYHSNEAIAIAHRWRERQGQYPSTMSTFAHELLFMDGPNNQTSTLSCTMGKADMQVRFSMAMAMLEHNRYTQAYALLSACAKDLRSTDSVCKKDYFPVMTELVKCCNILKQEEQGEAIALEALQHRCTDTATRNDICQIQIALADSLVGQSNYFDADKILEKVLASECLSSYLTIVASLRLNKVRRRLGVSDLPAFARNGALRKALTYAMEPNDHIKDECLEELSCTISFMQRRTAEDVAVAKAVLGTASAVVARHSTSASNWRTRILHEQIAHESGHKTHGQHHAKMPTDARGSPKSTPLWCLRVLLLHEGWESSTWDRDLHREMSALFKPDIEITTMRKRDLTFGMLDLSLNLVFLQVEQDFSSSIASILHEQGFTGPEASDWRGEPSWALFHRLLDASMPDFVPTRMSLPDIKHFLVSIQEEVHYSMGHENSLGSCTLRKLGLPRSDYRFTNPTYTIGISQANLPTSTIVSCAEDACASTEWFAPEINGNIIFPHPQNEEYGNIILHYPQNDESSIFEGLNPSMVKIGRFIEDLDRPSVSYYDSELTPYSEGTLWKQGARWLLFDCDTNSLADTWGWVSRWRRTRELWTEGIKTYWSICSHRKTDPIFAESSEKIMLTDWISDKHVVFLITAYQTCINAVLREKIMEREDSTGSYHLIRSTKLLDEKVAALCVREVRVVQSPEGEATLDFGNEFWRVYWGLVDKEAESDNTRQPGN